ncbi:reverse transcriptase domain-containing protein [Tanacetum coccineum]
MTQLQLQSTSFNTANPLSETPFSDAQTAMAKLREPTVDIRARLTEPFRPANHGQNQKRTDSTTSNMTPEAVQTMIDQALMRNSGGGDGSHSSHENNPRNMHTARPCYYADFMKCHPLSFKGTEGVVGLTRWIEKMESVFNISGLIRSLGPNAYTMTWVVLKKKMTDKYCPLGEVQKLEIELWNLKVKGNDVPAYTNRFQELALICTKFVSTETEKVTIHQGLPDNIYGNVKSARPKTLDETIELANELMDQKLRTYAERQSDNKRKADDISRNNQQPFKKQNVAKAYNLGTAEKKTYEGNAPKCTKCQRHHPGPCTLKCHKCGKIGHYARDCRSTGNTNATLTIEWQWGQTPRDGCLSVETGTDQERLSYAKEQNCEMEWLQGWLAVGNAERNGKAAGNPNYNNKPVHQCSMVVTGGKHNIMGLYFKFLESPFTIDPMPVKNLAVSTINDRYGLNEKEHEEHLKAILGLLKEEKLYAKFQSGDFGFRRKKISFDWGEKEEDAFQLIKQKLCKENGDFLCLPTVKIHEKNYTTQDLELVSVVFSSQLWRNTTYRRNQMHRVTDHKKTPLQHILEQCFEAVRNGKGVTLDGFESFSYELLA